MSYEEERKRARGFVALLLEDRELTDEELKKIIAHKGEISRYLDGLSRFATSGAERETRYRARKIELGKLDTKELRRRSDEMGRSRGQAMRDDTYDELPDEFFESPPKDSDEHIVYELLEERKKPVTARKK